VKNSSKFIIFAPKKAKPFLLFYRKKLNDEANIEIEIQEMQLPEHSAVISTTKNLTGKAERELENILAGKELKTDESFIIKVSKEYSLVSARSFSGLLCGLAETYHQIKKNTGKPLLENSVSSPAVKNRFYHICMSGTTPNIESLIELMKDLKILKYNGIVIEFENKFPYKKHNSFLHQNHYMLEDIKKIRKTAKEFALQIVPLVQCLGHLEFLLKFDEFKGLCEKKGHVSSACPLKNGTFDLFKSFAGEILFAFPETKYFHIGADEVRVHGKCPECKKHEKKNGKYSAFAEYIKKVTNYLFEMKIIPMIWDDIIYRHYPDVRLDGLSKQTIIVNWDYWTKNTQKTSELIFVPGRIGITTSRKRMFDINKFHPPEQDGEKITYEASAFFEDYRWEKMKIYDFIKTKDFPATVKAFPVIEMIKSDGFVPAGASNVRKSLQGTENQDFLQRVLNNKAWGEKLKSSNVDFFIATSWGRGNSLKEPVFNMELMKYTLASGGYFSWNGNGTIEDYDEYFDALLNRLDQPKLSLSLQDLLKGLYSIRSGAFYSEVEKNLLPLKNSKTPFYQMLYLYCKNFLFSVRYESYMERLKKYIYRLEQEKNYPSQEKKQIQQTLETYKKQIQKIEKEAIKILIKYVVPEEASELVTSIFYYKKIEINSLLEIIHKSEQN